MYPPTPRHPTGFRPGASRPGRDQEPVPPDARWALARMARATKAANVT